MTTDRVARIVWTDNSFMSAQSDTPCTPVDITSVGLVSAETEEYITIYRDKIGREWRGQESILKVNIKSMDFLS